MGALLILTVMAGVSFFNNIYDYISFTRKHHETQDEIKHLQAEVLSLNRSLGYMTNEIRENNKIIKELKSKIEEAKA